MNIREIAKLAGVSVASVSRAINGKDSKKLAPQTRERILKICEEHRYAPNGHMLRMSARRAYTIAFLIPSNDHQGQGLSVRMDDNLSAAILGAEEELSQSSIFLNLAVLSDKFLAAKTHLESYRNKTVDGMLVWGWSGGDYLQELVEEGVPAVLLQGEAEGIPVSSVCPEDRDGMRMLADYVVGRGHRHIALVPPLLAGSVGRERLRGMQEGLHAHGLVPTCVSKEAGYVIETGCKACREILARAPETTCIMASNDLTALGVIKTAREMGIAVPGQLSVTGADGVELHGQVALTTFASSTYTIGQKAARLLQAVVDDPDRPPERLRVPVTLVPGATVAAPTGMQMHSRSSNPARHSTHRHHTQEVSS